MQLNGSCHCKAVQFSVDSSEPAPFLRCYCSICRKTAGSGGYGINLGAKADTLELTGAEHIRRYDPKSGDTDDAATGPRGRRFCGRCGSALWNFDPRWPKFLHPHASAIDTELPVPPEHTHIMLGSAANWAEPHIAEGDKQFDDYPNESLADWHCRVLSE